MQVTVARSAAARGHGRSFSPVAVLRRLLGRGANLVGIALLAPLVFLAIAGAWLPLPNPTDVNPSESLQAPSLKHPLGTDKLGRDVLSRIAAGSRVSLTVAFTVAAIALAVGVAVGTLCGVMGRWFDGAVMAVVDILLSFPSLLLAIGFVAVFRAGLWQVVLAIALADIPRAIRLQRAMALGIAPRSYMDAARMVSARPWWLVLRHVIPNTIAPMLVVASIYAANAVLVEASLSFLGLGIVPPQPSWGNMIAEGRPYLQSAWWISTFPGVAIVIAAIALHLFSDGARVSLDPRTKA